MNSRWGEGVWSALVALADRLATTGPAVVVLVTLIALGLIVGMVLRALTSRLARALGLDRHTERWGVGASMRGAGIFRPPSEVVGSLFFWAAFVVFASLGIDSLAFGRATAFLVAFVPPLFAAVLILLVGWLIANFLSQGLLIAAVNAGLPEARLLARAVHWGVLLFAVATALTHLGIGKEMVLVAFGITFGGLVFALALAFGLGGRHVARELLERRLRRDSPPARERLTHL
jgi:mechanosensitive ion channel-like protein